MADVVVLDSIMILSAPDDEFLLTSLYSDPLESTEADQSSSKHEANGPSVSTIPTLTDGTKLIIPLSPEEAATLVTSLFPSFSERQ